MSPKRKAIAHIPLTMRLHPRDTHANPLFRTRAISSAREPAIPSLGHLIRTWTRYSEPGQHRPHAEQRVNMRNRGSTHGTGAQPYTRPATSHVDPLFRTRAISSARGPAIPNLGNPAHMRNRGFTRGTRWSPSRCRARMIRHESWGSRTRPRCFSIYISEACTTTCNRDFPTPASRRVTTPATRSVLNTNSRRGFATSETSYRAEEIIAQGKPESACAGRPRRSRTCPVPRTAS